MQCISSWITRHITVKIAPGPQGDQGLAMTDGQPVESATGPPPDQVKTPAQGKLV